MEHNCSGMWNMANNSNCTAVEPMPNPDIEKGASLTVIWIVAVVGNILTLAIVLGYKLRKVPDLLVFGLACTDLVACAFPIPISLWSYYSGRQIDGTEHLVRLCSAYSVVAKFTRDSSVFIVTLMVVDRFVWVLRPIQYHHGDYLKFFYISLPTVWLLAILISLLSLIPGVDVEADGNICLFGFQNWYGILVIVYGLVQFVVVLVCFVIVIVEVVKLARRRKRVVMKGKNGSCHSTSPTALVNNKLSAVTAQQEKVENGHHTAPTELPVGLGVPRLSCLKWAKTQLKCIYEKAHPTAEQQFAIMFSAIMILFYISWLPIVCLILFANVAQVDDPHGNGEALFWTIRMTVISTAINPFLYGILGGRYRRVYLYCLRAVFSKCCRCIRAPGAEDKPFGRAERTGTTS